MIPRTQNATSALHADGRVGITEEGLEEIVLAVQEDAAKAHPRDTAARAVGVLTTEVQQHACGTVRERTPINFSWAGLDALETCERALHKDAHFSFFKLAGWYLS